VLAGLLALAAGALQRRALWRRYAIFVLLSVLAGPGLIINVVFKDHWERPRPRDVVEFGGPLHYDVAPLRGEGGASFPCGHCSVGFLYALGWWVWSGRRPRLAAASIAAGAVAGSALGLGRMAAGGHFLSDVLWSALIALAIAHFLYYYILRVPAAEARERGVALQPENPRSQVVLALLAVLGGASVLLALFGAPHGTRIAAQIPLASIPQAPRVFEVLAGTADVEITVVDKASTGGASVSVAGELHGFGLPTSELSAGSELVTAPLPTLVYRIRQRGWFTDLNSSIAVRLPADDLTRLTVHLDRGNIRVTDATREGVTHSGRLALELSTRAGVVQRP
jgi:membrane-associated phospholipid phosphatase